MSKNHRSKVQKMITFAYTASKGRDVSLAGSFNGWDPGKNQMKYRNGRYSTRLQLPRGKHEYKFVVDGLWHVDPECMDWKLNEYGTLNSIKFVR